MTAPRDPVSYATPQPKRGRNTYGWRMIAALIVLPVTAVTVGLISARFTVTPQVMANRGKPVMAPAPPTVPSRFTIQQRTTQTLPGTNGELTVRIGDITGNRTMLTISDPRGGTLLSTMTTPGATHRFSVGTPAFDIETVELRNHLIGQDFATFALRAADTPVDENEKIQRLLDAIERAGDARFIRNGEEHSPADAAAHLRRKYESAKKNVPTARLFIDEIASKSKLSGDAYQIRLADGQTRPLRDWLNERLIEIEESTRQR